MGNIVNLQQYRKKLKRRQASLAAAENRLHHGLPKRDRESMTSERGRRDRDLDGKRIEPGPAEDEPPTPA
jgi:hypothetical protein